MKNITTYIIEKLHINKDSKNPLMDCNVPKESDYKEINNILKYCNKDNFGTGFQDLAEQCSDKDKLIRLWIATMLKTGSIPYIFKDTICSLPGNFGKDLINKAIDLGANKEDIFLQYDLQKNTKEEIHNTVINYFNKGISVILDKIFINDNYATTLKYDDLNNYSDTAKDINHKRNGIISIPFKIICNGKTVDAEFSFLGYTYYNFRLKNKDYKWSISFADDLIEEFDI